MEYKLVQQVKVVTTHHFADTIQEILKEENYQKPLIVIDNFLLGQATIQNMLDRLDKEDVDYTIYDRIVPDPPIELIDSGADFFKENQCDSILAIGGGSVIDAARAINIVRYHGGSARDYVFDKQVPSFCPGLISCPTTSGTGSELSNAAVITDTETEEKLAILADNAVSEYAVLCPELVVSLPVGQTIITGLDVFSHAAEAYTSTLSSPVVDAICEKIMFLVVKYLPKAVRNGQDLEARERMLIAAALGGWVINNGGKHLGHSQAHIVGAKLHIPHGMACGYALPGTLLFTAQVEPKKVREIGNILGCEFPADVTDMEIGEITAQAYKEFRDEQLGLPAFDAQGISRDQLLDLVDEVVNERFASNAPMEVTPELVTQLLERFG